MTGAEVMESRRTCVSDEVIQTGGRTEMRVEELPQVDKAYSRVPFTVGDNGRA